MLHPLNVFFDKIFVISIKRNNYRMEMFVKNNPDLEFEIFPGIDGTELFPSIDNVCNFPLTFFTENQLLFDRCQVWNKGQLGCAISNLLVQKEIIKRKLQKVLILEDDAFFLISRIPHFFKAINELPDDWEMLYLGFNPISKRSEHPITKMLLTIKYLMKPTSFESMSSNVGKRFFSISFSANLNRPGLYLGTHAYALSYEGAKKIVAIDTPLQHGFDKTLMHATYNGLINGFSLKRPLIIPNNKFSTSLIN